MSGEISWEYCCDAAALAELEPEWWTLWDRCSSATPFQSPAWLIPWWRAFAPGEIRVLAGRSAKRLIALAPFYLERGPYGRRLLPIGVSLSDYQDILVDDAWWSTLCGNLLASMAEQQADWESWEITELAPDAQALSLIPPEGCEDFVEYSSACPVLLLPPGIQARTDIFPSRKRRDLRSAQRRAAKRGVVEISAATVGSASSMLEALFRLHRVRWERRGEEGVVSDSRVQQFQREAVPRLHAAGLLRLYELRIAGRIVAIYYGMQHRNRAYAYLTGFDPDYEFESPGALLLAHVIEQAMHSGASEFHFLRGNEPYKYSWGAEDRWNRRRIVRRPQIYARAS